MSVNAKPDGYHTITPYLVVDGAVGLIDFLKAGFGAHEIHRLVAPDGRIGHAEVQIGDSRIMIGDATQQHQPIPAMLHLYVDDVDRDYKRAVEAGATAVQPPADQFYGDRSGGVKDRFGNLWWIATHIEDVPPHELERRAALAMQQDEPNK